jgi:hypothetical protein
VPALSTANSRVQDLVPGFVRWLVSSIWFTKEIDCAVHAMREDKMLKRRHETLMQDLFWGGLSQRKGHELWSHFVEPVL